jgi:hypothetical protein
MRHLTTIVTSFVTFFATIVCACDSNRAVTSEPEMTPSRKHCCRATQPARPDGTRHEHKQACPHCRPIIAAFAEASSSVAAPVFHACAIPLLVTLDSLMSLRDCSIAGAPQPPDVPAPTLLRQQCALAL